MLTLIVSAALVLGVFVIEPIAIWVLAAVASNTALLPSTFMAAMFATSATAGVYVWAPLNVRVEPAARGTLPTPMLSKLTPALVAAAPVVTLASAIAVPALAVTARTDAVVSRVLRKFDFFTISFFLFGLIKDLF